MPQKSKTCWGQSFWKFLMWAVLSWSAAGMGLFYYFNLVGEGEVLEVLGVLIVFSVVSFKTVISKGLQSSGRCSQCVSIHWSLLGTPHQISTIGRMPYSMSYRGFSLRPVIADTCRTTPKDFFLRSSFRHPVWPGTYFAGCSFPSVFLCRQWMVRMNFAEHWCVAHFSLLHSKFASLRTGSGVIFMQTSYFIQTSEILQRTKRLLTTWVWHPPTPPPSTNECKKTVIIAFLNSWFKCTY